MTRRPADASAVRRLMATAGRRIASPTTIYLVGGATAVLHGWRQTTDAVDMKIVSSDEDAATRVPAALRDELGLNIPSARRPFRDGGALISGGATQRRLDEGSPR